VAGGEKKKIFNMVGTAVRGGEGKDDNKGGEKLKGAQGKAERNGITGGDARNSSVFSQS